MKKLLFQALACAAVLLPFSQAQAKSFGGFKSGKTFTFKVEEVISAKAVGFNKATKAPIPAGVPKYKKGQKVKFKIGAKGQLIAKGVSIPFKADGGSANVYNSVKRSRTGVSSVTGEVFKNTKNKPTGVALFFQRTKVAGFSTTTNTVTYTLR